jgi:hypothetical protein
VLTPQASVVAIGLHGNRVTSPAQVTGALTAAGADPAAVRQALAQAAAHPDQFVSVLTVPDDARYEQQLRPALYPVPGVEFRRSTARQPISPDLASHVVGSVGPVTAEQVAQLGEPYLSGDVVGQTGIEGAYELMSWCSTPRGTPWPRRPRFHRSRAPTCVRASTRSSSWPLSMPSTA